MVTITAILHYTWSIGLQHSVRILNRVRWCCNRGPLLAQAGAALSGVIMCSRYPSCVHYTGRSGSVATSRYQSGSSTATVIPAIARTSSARVREPGGAVAFTSAARRAARSTAGVPFGAAGRQRAHICGRAIQQALNIDCRARFELQVGSRFA
jgi:hypothetical protein